MVCQLRKINYDVNINWQNLQNIESKKYICGYCGNAVASAQGWLSKMHNPDTGQSGNGPTIYICHHCDRPTFFDTGESQYPGAPFGSPIAHITSTEVAELYTESIDCMKVNAYTASVICSRKILMYIAVNKGAEENLKFEEYIDFLDNKGYVPPDGKEWVERIKDKGDEPNYQIRMMNREDTEILITFVGMLLKFIYEFPGMLKSV